VARHLRDPLIRVEANVLFQQRDWLPKIADHFCGRNGGFAGAFWSAPIARAMKAASRCH
jgi:hypothetical protein